VARCGGGEPVTMCGGVGQHKDGGSSPRRCSDGAVEEAGGAVAVLHGSGAPVNSGGRWWVLQLKGVERHEVGQPLGG
jgi:hypothetical protein